MTRDPLSLGWAVAGLLFLASGLGLCVRARAYLTGSLFALTGALLIALRFPLGHVDTASIAVMAMIALAAAITTYPRPAADLPQALALAGVLLGAPVLARRLGQSNGLDAGEVAWIAFSLATVVMSHLWWRLETTLRESRGALLWVLSTSAVTLFLTGIVALAGTPAGLATVVHASLGLIGVAALVGTNTVAIVDGRWAASRAAAWSFTIACMFAAATLIFTLIQWSSNSSPGIVSLAVATVVCGAFWHPLLKVIQTVSDGALFGFRPDALSAVQRVAVSIGDDPTAAVRAIQEGMVLPYAALTVVGEDRIEVGTPSSGLQRTFPIDSGEEHLGELVVGIRPGDLGLSSDDVRVLNLTVPLLVQTVKARSQTASLQRARVAAASAREEERRRLRRDLHDGLGPTLTGIAFTADAAKLANADPTITAMLDRIRHEAETAIDEIRELVNGLRPPALDELGLLGAITVQTQAFPGLLIHIDAHDLPALPAAVEVAAYRIIIEALTNIARHSGATHARIGLQRLGDRLAIEITDNGNTDTTWVPGVGLTSMKERASELNGTLTYAHTLTGSSVAAQLPLDR